jgi:hypothetical protein
MQSVQFLCGLIAGGGGLVIGAFLGAAAGGFITGEKGLHGFSGLTMCLFAVGAVIGLLAGIRVGTVTAGKLMNKQSSTNPSD